MEIVIRHVVEAGPTTEQRLHRIERAVNVILSRMIAFEKEFHVDLNSLQTQVQANTDVEQSAITLLQGLAAQLRAAATDPVRIQQLADQLHTSADSLSAAIVANTPAAPSTPTP